jgi:hypothetical protein
MGRYARHGGGSGKDALSGADPTAQPCVRSRITARVWPDVAHGPIPHPLPVTNKQQAERAVWLGVYLESLLQHAIVKKV